MPATQPDVTPSALTDVLVQTIRSNAEMLRLLAPERYQELLAALQRDSAPSALLSDDEAWSDLERWLSHFREQDRAAVGA